MPTIKTHNIIKRPVINEQAPKYKLARALEKNFRKPDHIPSAKLYFRTDAKGVPFAWTADRSTYLPDCFYQWNEKWLNITQFFNSLCAINSLPPLFSIKKVLFGKKILYAFGVNNVTKDVVAKINQAFTVNFYYKRKLPNSDTMLKLLDDLHVTAPNVDDPQKYNLTLFLIKKCLREAMDTGGNTLLIENNMWKFAYPNEDIKQAKKELQKAVSTKTPVQTTTAPKTNNAVPAKQDNDHVVIGEMFVPNVLEMNTDMSKMPAITQPIYGKKGTKPMIDDPSLLVPEDEQTMITAQTEDIVNETTPQQNKVTTKQQSKVVAESSKQAPVTVQTNNPINKTDVKPQVQNKPTIKQTIPQAIIFDQLGTQQKQNESINTQNTSNMSINAQSTSNVSVNTQSTPKPALQKTDLAQPKTNNQNQKALQAMKTDLQKILNAQQSGINLQKYAPTSNADGYVIVRTLKLNSSTAEITFANNQHGYYYAGKTNQQRLNLSYADFLKLTAAEKKFYVQSCEGCKATFIDQSNPLVVKRYASLSNQQVSNTQAVQQPQTATQSQVKQVNNYPQKNYAQPQPTNIKTPYGMQQNYQVNADFDQSIDDVPKKLLNVDKPVIINKTDMEDMLVNYNKMPPWAKIRYQMRDYRAQYQQNEDDIWQNIHDDLINYNDYVDALYKIESLGW